MTEDYSAMDLDSIDLRLLTELERDADRPNVELARLAGLSPAATLHRVRRLKDGGVIEAITAQVDHEAAGFPLSVYVTVTVGRHDEAAHDRLQQAVESIPQVIRADWIAGETDALLEVVARSIAELQRVQLLLSSRGGAQRVTTLLRLEVLKRPSPLPHAVDDAPPRRVRRSARG
jgi:Lrp/AsnC family leucine-responsive transcriptional regulator